MGAALTLDEFALWLNLANVYWSRQGRESIDAVVLFGSLLAIGTWGAPFGPSSCEENNSVAFAVAISGAYRPGSQTRFPL